MRVNPSSIRITSVHEIQRMAFLCPYKVHSQFKSVILALCLARLNFYVLYLHKSRFCTSKTAIPVSRIPII